MSPPASLIEALQSALGDAYTIEREIGAGGMSRVFSAQETALGRQVAIKVLHTDLTAGLSAERFAREVRLAARLQQANIGPLLSAGTVQSTSGSRFGGFSSGGMRVTQNNFQLDGVDNTSYSNSSWRVIGSFWIGVFPSSSRPCRTWSQPFRIMMSVA